MRRGQEDLAQFGRWQQPCKDGLGDPNRRLRNYRSWDAEADRRIRVLCASAEAKLTLLEKIALQAREYQRNERCYNRSPFMRDEEKIVE